RVFEIEDENAQKAMTREERIAFLDKRLNEMREAIDKGGGWGLLNFDQTRIAEAKLTGQVAELRRKKDKFETTIVTSKPDPLAKIGGFTGASQSRLVAFTERIANAT